MYKKSAAYYDAIYHWKDYAAESNRLHAFIRQYKRSAGNTLLDVACGTGAHLAHLREHYRVMGLDYSADMLAVARELLPDVPLVQGDMRTFALDSRFDVLVCLFSSIGYMLTVEALHESIANFTRHLMPGGIVVVEPWLTPENWKPGTVHANYVDQAELKVARITYSSTQGTTSVMELHHLVGVPTGVEYFVERFEMGLFTHEQYLEAFSTAGLTVDYDAQGLMGRGLYFGVRSLA